ncbi:hypothetical protein FH972_020495 [Carpinus fangiana]|uniref:Uncharacterized protein n=1 Tax=Carpinus fangiana TaxID=176857 RepID=A0A5N6RWJ1_9ROSI|nr:hypothetical protein FH972_020495 [Carpinus fangiana]
MDGGGKYWSSGGLERPRDLPVEPSSEITPAACQEQHQILLSGQEARRSVFFCYIQ